MELKRKRRVFIGIPCYQDVSYQTLEDYMRFSFHLGRRLQDYDFFLGVKPKSEQFRARNALVEGALQVGADYMLMIDDDHIIDFEGLAGTTSDGVDHYNFIKVLLDHLEEGRADIVGPIYYHRGGTVSPVVMMEGEMGGYKYLQDHELTGGLQEVDVQGGGCMLINMKIFDKIEHPWFAPEFEYGTDIQVCRKAKKFGYKVCTDSSIEIGHVKTQRVVVCSQNKETHREEKANEAADNMIAGWGTESVLHRLKYDALEFLGISSNEGDKVLNDLYNNYSYKSIANEENYGLGTEDYYRHLGDEQLGRQVLFHHSEVAKAFMSFLFSGLKDSRARVGMDFGCGAGAVGFELCKRGHTMHFHDIEGARAFEFVKWRVKKYGIEDRAKFNVWPEPESLDYCMMLDVIEHLHNWKGVLDKVLQALKFGGHFITNFIPLSDHENVEHVFMDKGEFARYMVDHQMSPNSSLIWTKIGRWANK